MLVLCMGQGHLSLWGGGGLLLMPKIQSVVWCVLHFVFCVLCAVLVFVLVKEHCVVCGACFCSCKLLYRLLITVQIRTWLTLDH